MTTIISRSEIFKMAWKSARARVSGFRNLRTAFAHCLRQVWALVKAAIAEEARAAARRPAWYGVDMERTREYNRSAARTAAMAERGTLCQPHCW